MDAGAHRAQNELRVGARRGADDERRLQPPDFTIERGQQRGRRVLQRNDQQIEMLVPQEVERILDGGRHLRLHEAESCEYIRDDLLRVNGTRYNERLTSHAILSASAVSRYRGGLLGAV